MNGLKAYITGDFDPIDQPDLALYEVELLVGDRQPIRLFKGKAAAFEYAMRICEKITGQKQGRNSFQVFNAPGYFGQPINARVLRYQEGRKS